VIEDSHHVGLFVMGSDARVDGTVVRGTLPEAANQQFGVGVHNQLMCTEEACFPEARANLTLRGSIVEQSFDFGVVSVDSDLVVEGIVVRDTQAQVLDGLFGDGVSIVAVFSQASAALASSRISRSARAGISSFASYVSLTRVAVECSAFPLDGESTFQFEDRGGNACGCTTADGTCQLVSAGLEPPAPLDGSE
jgi:hypothetical protein